MAVIKPFRGLRYDSNVAGKVETLTCPPYDIISEEQRKGYINRNSYNVIRLELPKGKNAYESAGETLREWKEKGALARDEEPALYIYEIVFEANGEKKSVKGFICRVKLEEFSKGVVLPHEETLSKAKTDRFNLMCATNCNFSQVYSLYMDEEKRTRGRIDSLSSQKPDVEMTDEAGLVHRVWVVTDKEAVEAVCGDFAERKLYIADGHHRYETALNYRNYLREQGIYNDSADYIMMMLVDMEHEGLVVFPTHRLVRGLYRFISEKLIVRCGQYFDISEHVGTDSIEGMLKEHYLKGDKAFALYCGGEKWHLLVLKSMEVMDELLPYLSEASRGLDVTVLHTLVFENILGIDKESMANQTNLTYTRDLKEAIRAVDSGEHQCAFILNPTRVTEIRDVAKAGEKMPQKSTYFYPKLITGLVMNEIED